MRISFSASSRSSSLIRPLPRRRVEMRSRRSDRASNMRSQVSGAVLGSGLRVGGRAAVRGSVRGSGRVGSGRVGRRVRTRTLACCERWLGRRGASLRPLRRSRGSAPCDRRRVADLGHDPVSVALAGDRQPTGIRGGPLGRDGVLVRGRWQRCRERGGGLEQPLRPGRSGRRVRALRPRGRDGAARLPRRSGACRRLRRDVVA